MKKRHKSSASPSGRSAPRGNGCRDSPQGLVVATSRPTRPLTERLHKPKQARPPPRAKTADENAIRATAEEFVKAFNAADAKAVGAPWASDAEYTDESGQSSRVARRSKRNTPNCSRSIRRDHDRHHRVDTLSRARHRRGKGHRQGQVARGGSATARYTVVHARRDGKWIMVVGRDAPYVPGSNEDYLKDLEWLIGDWTVAAKDRPLRLHFEWMAQRNFIKNTYILTKDGQATLTGGQIIGWNPKLGHIVSWHFDAQGGFGDDVWIKDGSKWVIEATGVFRNGSESSAVNIADAHRRQQLHLAIGKTHSGRREPARYAAGENRKGTGTQVIVSPLTGSKKPARFSKGVSK